MTETMLAPGADVALSDDTGTNVSGIAPFGCNDDSLKSDLCDAEALETTRPISKIEAPRRGRGRPTGPSLKILLTQNFPDGATADVLIFRAGFRGDLAAALKREDIKEQDGRYVWVAMSKSEASDITDPRASPNLLAPVPPAPVVDLGHLNKEELRTEPFRIEEISLDKIRIRARRRRTLDQAKVDAIADSMGRIGLQTPITVYQTDNDEFELGPGLHRHAAAKLLGW